MLQIITFPALRRDKRAIGAKFTRVSPGGRGYACERTPLSRAERDESFGISVPRPEMDSEGLLCALPAGAVRSRSRWLGFRLGLNRSEIRWLIESRNGEPS